MVAECVVEVFDTYDMGGAGYGGDEFAGAEDARGAEDGALGRFLDELDAQIAEGFLRLEVSVGYEVIVSNMLSIPCLQPLFWRCCAIAHHLTPSFYAPQAVARQGLEQMPLLSSIVSVLLA